MLLRDMSVSWLCREHLGCLLGHTHLQHSDMSPVTGSFLLLVLCCVGISANGDAPNTEPDKNKLRPGNKPGECMKVPFHSRFVCPHNPNYTKPECGSDWDCDGNQKCCSYLCRKQCRNPVEKPGSCPIPFTRCAGPPPRGDCTTDSQCGGTKKCCTPYCTQTCVEPLKPE
ncbi:antileukoproteinase-like isoform X2 [Pseudophryne corroboree]|uniref:antileukoproteinase-like isoform X2 n=1 Tax=Pseudophryne corroboree TaxID=495146 RepID=UPI003081A657